MLLNSLVKRRSEAYYYLERYVNDGSPSGFTETNRTSPNTDPFGLTPWFHLYIATVDPSMCRQFGEIPKWACSESSILLHPDIAVDQQVSPAITPQLYDEFRVTPTSSARTVQFVDAPAQDFVKLDYARLLGRVKRGLPFSKAVAGPELSEIITKAIKEHRLHPSLWVMPETTAVQDFREPLLGSGRGWSGRSEAEGSR